MLTTDTATVYNDFASLGKLKQAAQQQSPEALKQVAKQFESVFLNMMLKSMRQAKLAEGALDSQQSEFYRDMYDQQLSLQLANNPGVGLAEFIVKQLSPKTSRNDNPSTVSDYLIDSAESSSVNKQTVKPAANNPINASGLNNLESSIGYLLNNLQNNATESWQSENDEWHSVKLNTEVKQAITNKQDFIDQLLPLAHQAARALGVDANLLLAQAALETGWGQAVIKSNDGSNSFNLFNIKADKSWQGKQSRTTTVEYEGGIAKKESTGFRAYNSYQESFIDYVDFIKSNPRYSQALKKADNAYQYISELQQAGYATDPKYAEKILNIYQSQLTANNRLNPSG